MNLPFHEMDAGGIHFMNWANPVGQIMKGADHEIGSLAAHSMEWPVLCMSFKILFVEL